MQILEMVANGSLPAFREIKISLCFHSEVAVQMLLCYLQILIRSVDVGLEVKHFCGVWSLWELSADFRH